jgi:hypothetical protein
LTVFIVNIGDVESHSNERAEGREAGWERRGREREKGGGGGRSDDEGKAGKRTAQEGEGAAVERGKGGAGFAYIVSIIYTILLVCSRRMCT